MKMNNRWSRLAYLFLSIVPCPCLCIEETLYALRPDGRITVIDGDLPDEESPSAFKIVLSMAFTLLDTDIYRRCSEIVRALEAVVEPNEPANEN